MIAVAALKALKRYFSFNSVVYEKGKQGMWSGKWINHYVTKKKNPLVMINAPQPSEERPYPERVIC